MDRHKHRAIASCKQKKYKNTTLQQEDFEKNNTSNFHFILQIQTAAYVLQSLNTYRSGEGGGVEVMNSVEVEQTRQRRKFLVTDAESQSSARLDPVDYVVPDGVLSTRQSKTKLSI